MIQKEMPKFCETRSDKRKINGRQRGDFLSVNFILSVALDSVLKVVHEYSDMLFGTLCFPAKFQKVKGNCYGHGFDKQGEIKG
jgi:hypothetical protein